MKTNHELLKGLLVTGQLSEIQLRDKYGLIVYPDKEGDLLITGANGKPRRANLTDLTPTDFILVGAPIGTLPEADLKEIRE